MTDLINEEEFREIVDLSWGFDIQGLWLSTLRHVDSQDGKEAFLQVLSRLLHEGGAKLALLGEFLEGSIDEQIDSFRAAWPDPADIEDVIFWAKKNGEVWIPGGLVWINVDGTLGWT